MRLQVHMEMDSMSVTSRREKVTFCPGGVTLVLWRACHFCPDS